MAYMNQERKKSLAPKIKAVLKKYGMKGTIAVRHHSTLICNIKSGELDILNNKEPSNNGHLSVNPYWIDHHYEGKVKDFLLELKDAMNVGNWDKSDIQTDYFNVGWYIEINVGSWDKPYLFTGQEESV